MLAAGWATGKFFRGRAARACMICMILVVVFLLLFWLLPSSPLLMTVSLWPGYTADDFMPGAYLGCDYMCTDIPVSLKEWITEKTPWLNVKY